LKADAVAAEWPDQTVESDNLVIVTEFFERPCPKYPEGRSMVFANGRPIVDQRLIDPNARTGGATIRFATTRTVSSTNRSASPGVPP
jgi:hypothetical protein